MSLFLNFNINELLKNLVKISYYLLQKDAKDFNYLLNYNLFLRIL